jgi:uncharacterized damage-inducible protein DinB
MDPFWRTLLWQQFGAALDMLENAIDACPAELWSDPSQRPAWTSHSVVGFWHLANHTLFFLDYYSFPGAPEAFRPPPPFGLEELDPEGVLPERPFTKEEVHSYLRDCRSKTKTMILALTDAEAGVERTFPSFQGPTAELLLSQMRHIQHHTAQMNLLLRQHTGSAPRWVSRARSGAAPT